MPRIRLAFVVSVLALVLAGCGGSPASTVPELPTSTTSRPTAPPTAPPTAISTSTPSSVGLPAFASNEPLLLYGHVTGAGGGIYVMRPDGSGRTQIGTDVLPGVHKRGGWSPDGQDVVFVDETTERLWIAHLDGRATSPVSTCMHGGCDYPAWSPDGTKIAYSRNESAAGVEGPASVGIEVIDLASGAVTQVVRLARPVLADFPKWSPDGSSIVIQVDQMDDHAFETGAALAIVPAMGGKPRYLTGFDRFASSPDWGWARDEIVFSTELAEAQEAMPASEGTWDLWGVQPDGTALRQITHVAEGGRVRSAKWTPDGTAIFAYDPLKGASVKVDPVTGAIEQLNLTSGNETRPSLRPLPAS